MFALYRRHGCNAGIEHILYENGEWTPLGKEDPYRVRTWDTEGAGWWAFQNMKGLDDQYVYYIGEYSIY